MTKPLALLCYENLLPGSQLVNRLQDLGYRVLSLTDASTLPAQTQQHKPFIIVVDLSSNSVDVCEMIRQIKGTPATSHIPVLAFARDGQEDLRTAAHSAGAALVAGDIAILAHLPEVLSQVLEV